MGKTSPKVSPQKGGGAALVDTKVLERKEVIETMAKQENVPKAVQPYILQYSLQIAQFAVFCQFTLLPLGVQAFEFCQRMWVIAKPHLTGDNMKDVVPALCGLCLCLFGGTFPLMIAAVEAFRLAGYDGMKKALVELYDEGQKALEAHKKDEAEDKDGDGIPDSQQQKLNEKLAHKALLILRVVNPDKITSAMQYLTTGLLAVLAALKMSFARAITLGATIGVVLRKQFDKYAGEKVLEVCPPEYRKWVPPVIDYVIKFIAVSIAFMLQNIISAVHSSIRGGQMLGNGVVLYLNRTGKLSQKPEDTNLDEVIGYSAAAFGFVWQLMSGFSVSFPLNLFLLPITMCESTLTFLITWL